MTAATRRGEPFAVSGPSAAVDVDAIGQDVVGYARVCGRDVPVLYVDGATYRVLVELEGSDRPEDVLELYGGVTRCCPSLTRDEVFSLRPSQIGAILVIAQRTVKQVEAQFPNGSAPTETKTESSSAPETQSTILSDTSSPESR